MSIEPTYARNMATEDQVAEHLRTCDSDFVPPLSERVDIAEYARKIHEFAERFEAWSLGFLVGLVAVYSGNDQDGACFITDVSVVPRFKHKGIASQLLRDSIEYVRSMGIGEVRLEVAVENHAAISLYEKFGFLVDRHDSTSMIMTKKPG